MKKQFLLSFIISFLFLSLGFLLLHYELIGYGLSFFVFLPFILGFILGKKTIRTISLIGLGFSLSTFFVLLFSNNLEGMVCILMALPLVIGVIIIGAAIKYLFERNQKRENQNDLLKSSLIPLFIFLGIGILEKKHSGNDKAVISVKTEMILPYSTMEVYEAIKSVDTLIAERPFLMRLDLPVPNKCILEKEEVGGLRTCYFTGGTITEKITQLEKGKVLRMDVIDYKLTGRKWLGFKEAIYYFDSIGNNSSRITRITTYTSELKPRFYWQPLEQIGIKQEHEYVFDNLRRDLGKKVMKNAAP